MWESAGLAVNHNTNVTSGKWIQCSKHIAWASELCSCQSNSCLSWGFEQLQKSKDSFKACFENVNITQYVSNNLGMLWVRKGTLSMKLFFWATKKYVKIDGYKDTCIHNFLIKEKIALPDLWELYFITNELWHVISNNVAFWQVLTQMSLCSLRLSLETPNGVRSVA